MRSAMYKTATKPSLRLNVFFHLTTVLDLTMDFWKREDAECELVGEAMSPLVGNGVCIPSNYSVPC
jgi:hypothetical protein